VAQLKHTWDLQVSNVCRYVDYAMHRVRMCKHFGVTPYLVFDGDFLPSKAGTEASRAKRREDSKKAGLELLRAGKPSLAHQELQKAIDVTPEMARNLIEELKKAGVPYVVAPYEADAQMVYLERQGAISGIISEDSDLLVFGAKRLLTKLDQYGKCIEINRKDFCAVREISLTGWTDVEFRHMAIFSGCDYLEGVGNMGLKTAYRMIRKHKTPEKVLRMLRFDGKFQVSENYLASFKQAELTFLHQRVFCPEKQELVFLTDPDPTLDIDNMPFIGAPVEPQLARAIASGDVNPITKEAIVLSPLPGRVSPKRRVSQLGPAMTPSKPCGKPIDAYFKGASRIPLGEMDPNCFAVDPNQTASRTQNGLLPRVFPLPRPYIDGAEASPARPYTTASTPRLRRGVTEPLNSILGFNNDNSSSTSSQDRRQTMGPLSGMPPIPDQLAISNSRRPAKKARLCEDLPLFLEDNEITKKSKFFATKKPKTSVSKPDSLPERSLGGTTKPKPRPSDTILFSDDSIEEALLELPDIDGWQRRKSMPTKKSTLQIFDDAAAVKEAAKNDIEVLASSPSEPVEQEGKLSRPTPSKTPIRATLQKFSYTPQHAKLPSSSGGARMAYGLPTPVSSMQKPRSSQPESSQGSSSRTFSSTPMPPPPHRRSLGTPIVTPLQRIGAQALQRGKLVSSTPPLTPKPLAPGNKDSNRRRSYAEMPVNPAFVPLPKVDIAEVEALNQAHGSEDQIVPDSDEENDPDVIDDPPIRNRLGLSKFLYS
jgi:exonuclease-1